MIRPFAFSAMRPLLAAALIGSTACAGPTEPPAPFEVAFRILGTPVLSITNLDGVGLRMECSVTAELSATGRGKADLTRLRIRRYRDTDRSVATDSVTQIAPLWAIELSDSLQSSTPDTAVLVSSSYQPFAVDYILWFRVRGQAAEDSVMQRVECGPSLAPGAASPSVSLLEIRGSDAVLEQGDTVIVRYRVEGGAPLWETRLSLYGPFVTQRNVYEEMGLLREREERFVIPQGAALGVPIAAWIMTTDIGERFATLRDTSDRVIVDVRPPVIDGVNVTPGQYAVGSSIRVTTTAHDERGLAHLVWEFGAPIPVRDSIPISLNENWLELAVRPEWAGNDGMLRIWVRDHGGNYSTPWVSAGSAFKFHPRLPAPTFTSGDLVSGSDVVYDARRGRLYAVDIGGARLRAFDIASMVEIGAVMLPPWPGAADLTVSGDSLLVTQSELRTLSVIDLATLSLIDTIVMPPVDSIALVEASNPPLPTGVRVLANGRAIVKLHKKAAGGFNTVEVSLQDGSSRLRTESTGGAGTVERWWDRMGVTADRSALLLFDPGCARRYSSLSDSFSSCAVPDPGDLFATRISSDSASSRVMIGGRVFASDLTPIATLPYTVTHLMPDGAYALAAEPETLFRIRVSDGRIMSRMNLPFNVSRMILLADGHTVIAFTEGFAGEVQVVVKFDTAVMP